MEQFETDWDNFVAVKYSPIEGQGIFAVADIPSDELIMVISGDVISGEECERREEEENNVYIFWNGEYYIDTANTDKIKFINHSCEPNCDVLDRDASTLNLVAKRNIKSGEELTIDYGYDEIYEMCRCEICSKE
ncbi:MAG: SET domain-containing protein [Bacteroidetes bacterium]|nr:SET domain-containing protein [Bacteroidota bacterium]